MQVVVVYGLASDPVQITVTLDEGVTVGEAINQLKQMPQCRDWLIDAAAVGVFGRVVALAQVLEVGDRLELYQPLEVDPKTARRLRAAGQKRQSS